MLYPKIGIRPTIDGRWGGIRESLEAQTMGLAQAAQTLISSLRYPDGTPVQAVISPCTIGGGAEAARCEEYFATQNVIATLTVTPCWCYGMETFDMNPHTIKAVWGFNGTERPGAVYLAAVLAAYGPEGIACLQHLRPGRSGPGGPQHPRGCGGKDAAIWPLRRGRGLDEEQRPMST